MGGALGHLVISFPLHPESALEFAGWGAVSKNLLFRIESDILHNWKIFSIDLFPLDLYVRVRLFINT
jgi:hypothetical protein